LLASKIEEDPKNLYFADACHHRMALTRRGILMDSHARAALQLKNRVQQKYEDIAYTLEGIGQDKLTFSYTVRLYPRTTKAILTRK
jgi:hypothetical protein